MTVICGIKTVAFIGGEPPDICAYHTLAKGVDSIVPAASGLMNEERAVYNQGYAAYNQGYAVYNQGYAAYNQGYAAYNQGYAAYNQGYAAYNQGYAAYNQGYATYNQGYAAYNPEYAVLSCGSAERFLSGAGCPPAMKDAYGWYRCHPIGSKEALCYSQPTMKLNGQAAVFFCAVLWSTSGLFAKLLPWHPILIAGMRSFIAALFLLAVRRLFPRRTAKSTRLQLILGGLSYALTMITFIIANKMTSAANAILLQYTAPVWTAILGGIILKEKLRAEHWAALAAVTVGLCIFFKDSWQISSRTLAGDCIALFSGLCFAANSVFLRMQKEGTPSDSLFLSHVVCAGFAIPFFFLYPPSFSLPSVGSILFMGVVQMGCASLLFSYGIKRVGALQSMLTAMVEPVLNPLWVLLIVGEKPSSATLIGGLIIIGALVGSSLAAKTRSK